MRDKQRTIEALRNLAERPGTPHEGETARRLLALMGGVEWVVKPLDPALFPVGTVVYYCYWGYENDRAIVMKGRDGMFQTNRGQTWMRLKFDRLKQPRWVPVTSKLGCHIGLIPFEGNEATTLVRMDLDWQQKDADFLQKLRDLGIDPTPISERGKRAQLTHNGAEY